MLFIFSIILIFISIKSKRIRENILNIHNGIISNISRISFSDKIKGTQNYVYKIESNNIYFNYFSIYLNNYNKTIIYYKPQILVFLKLYIYEEDDTDIFELKSNYKNGEIISDKAIVSIYFESISFFEQYKDFSFNMSAKIIDLKNNITINYHQLKDINLFQYLLYNETSKLYNNTTLYEYSKQIVFQNLLKQINNNLFYYPECDALINFKLLYDYFLNREFNIYIPCDNYYYNKGTVQNFTYEEIVKQNTSIILKNIKIRLFYLESVFDSDSEYIEKKDFELKEITIKDNYEVIFPDLGEFHKYKCLLETFKEIINKTKNALGIK